MHRKMAKKGKSKSLSIPQENRINIAKQRIKAAIIAADANNKLNVALEQFKFVLEEAIKTAGDKGKESVIRSQEPIKLFHEVVKSELIRNGVAPDLIVPQLGVSAGELNIYGFMKDKSQDISVLNRNAVKTPEIITAGMTKGRNDILGKDYTEKTFVVNVRSQMSSIAKNVDTIFERTFAETLNLHMRCPRMVLGEFFILPVTGYDMAKVIKKNPKFEDIKAQVATGNLKSTAKVLEEFIYAFASVNNRNQALSEDFKYERVCLLIADFTKTPIKVYNTNAELIADNLLPNNTTASMNGLAFPNFIADLLAVYTTRFGAGSFN